MPVVPYLSFTDECAEAIQLYREAFDAEVLESFTFGETAAQGAMPIPPGTEARIMQAVLNICDGHVRMSDNFGTGPVSSGERVSIAVEAERALVEKAYSRLAREGAVSHALEATFFSPAYGSVIDPFGVKWELAALPE